MARMTLADANARRAKIEAKTEDLGDLLDDLSQQLGDPSSFVADIKTAGESTAEWLTLLEWAKKTGGQSEPWMTPYLAALKN